MAFDPISLGIGAAGSIIDNTIGAVFDGISAKRQYNYQKKLMDKQFGYQQQLQEDAQAFSNEQMKAQQDWSYKMWQENNEYNSQASIDERMREAGRNPYLANASTIGSTTAQAGGFSSAGQGSASGGSVSAVKSSYTPLSAVAQAFSNMRVQNAQIQGILADVQGKHIENKYKEVDTILNLQKIIAETKNTRLRNQYQTVANMFAQDMFQQDYINKLETNKNLKLQGQSMGYTIAAQALQNSYLDKQLQIDICIKNAQLFSEWQRGKLTKAQYKYQLIENLVADKTKDDKVEGVKSEYHHKKLDYNTATRIADYLVQKAENETMPNSLGGLPNVIYGLYNRFAD